MSTETQALKHTGEESQTEHTRSGQYFRPSVDILERSDELTVLADVPGVTAQNVDIHFEDGVLSIHGRVEPRQKPDTRFLLQEYGVGDFYRTFQVSEQIDPSRITAELAQGVLTLHLPKSEAARPRKIAVQGR